MNENLLRYALMFCIFLSQVLVIWIIPDKEGEYTNAMIIGAIYGIIYVVTWIKCPKLKVVKNGQ